jgi:hypothetical protein
MRSHSSKPPSFYALVELELEDAYAEVLADAANGGQTPEEVADEGASIILDAVARFDATQKQVARGKTSSPKLGTTVHRTRPLHSPKR